MARGFVWAIYQDDTGEIWRVRVDADYVDQVERGWVTANPAVTAPLPRGWQPRAVFGPDEEGRRRSARVASLSAALWTGEATTFEIEGTDQLLHLVRVTEHRSEVRD